MEMRGGDSRARNNALETISAAANVIAVASADNRVPQASTTVRKQRWWNRWSIYWCFGSPKHRKRIGHAVLIPETIASATNDPAPGYPARPSVIALPFAAPPSSPASFLQSEPPSATQSPVSLVSLSPMPAMYSPCGQPSIFAIGPYAYETQLVSPPVFSTFTTEPSTAPLTPPPESIHLTTPSSPEVPFAQLFNPNHQGDGVGHRFPVCQNYEFQFYQLPPGSPLGQLISPRSAVSGSGRTSPFTDGEIVTGSPRFCQFRVAEPPKLVSADKLSGYGRRTSRDSGTFTPDTVSLTSPNRFFLDHQTSESTPHQHLGIGCTLSDLNSEDVVRCVQKKFKTLCEANSLRQDNSSEMLDSHARPTETTNKLITGKDSGANGKVVAEDDGVEPNWSFFPVMHPAVR